MNDNPVKDDIQNFRKSSLKKTETKECCTLPTAQDIEQEKKQNEDQKQQS